MDPGVQLVTPKKRRRRRSASPYLLIGPGGLWLLAFFVVPLFFMLSVSLQTGDLYQGFRNTWRFANYTDAISRYHVQFVRSLTFGTIATIATSPIRSRTGSRSGVDVTRPPTS